MARKKTKKTAFVPRLLVRTAIAGVVPACALACGGSTTATPGGESASNASQASSASGGASNASHMSATGGGASTSHVNGVATVAYSGYSALGVAATSYQVRDAGASSSKVDGSAGDAAARDGASDAAQDSSTIFTVAAVAYPAYEGGPVPLAVRAYEIGHDTEEI